MQQDNVIIYGRLKKNYFTKEFKEPVSISIALISMNLFYLHQQRAKA
jgi:hypothetical protein